MGHRAKVLTAHGYQVAYRTCRKYRGSDEIATQCVAIKGGARFFAFKICHPVCEDHFRRIHSAQASIPNMAPILMPIEDVVLIGEAHGHMLWDLEAAPDPDAVENGLDEFVRGAQAHGLIHGDLRPWNIFFDGERGVQVIDWWSLSSFVDDLVRLGDQAPRRADLLEREGHYVKFHPDLVAQGKFTEIDQADAMLIGKLVRGHVKLSDQQVWLGYYDSLGRFPWQESGRGG